MAAASQSSPVVDCVDVVISQSGRVIAPPSLQRPQLFRHDSYRNLLRQTLFCTPAMLPGMLLQALSPTGQDWSGFLLFVVMFCDIDFLLHS